MVRIFQVKDLTERKQLLLVQSDVHRETLKLQIATAQVTLNHIRSRLVALEVSSFAFKTAADIASLFISRSQPAAAGGFFSKVLSGFKFFNQVRDFFGRRKSGAAHDGHSDS